MSERRPPPGGWRHRLLPACPQAGPEKKVCTSRLELTAALQMVNQWEGATSYKCMGALALLVRTLVSGGSCSSCGLWQRTAVVGAMLTPAPLRLPRYSVLLPDGATPLPANRQHSASIFCGQCAQVMAEWPMQNFPAATPHGASRNGTYLGWWSARRAAAETRWRCRAACAFAVAPAPLRLALRAAPLPASCCSDIGPGCCQACCCSGCLHGSSCRAWLLE